MTEQQACAYLRARGYVLVRIDGRQSYQVGREVWSPERVIALAVAMQADRKLMASVP